MKSRDCKTCSGTGDCQECEGSGSCQVCNGERQDGFGNPCEDCDEGECCLCEGVGDCEDCNGTGKDQMDKDREAAIRRSWGHTKAADDLIHSEVTIAGLRELRARYKALGFMGPDWDLQHQAWYVDKFSEVWAGECKHVTYKVGTIAGLLDPEAITALDERE